VTRAEISRRDQKRQSEALAAATAEYQLAVSGDVNRMIAAAINANPEVTGIRAQGQAVASTWCAIGQQIISCCDVTFYRSAVILWIISMQITHIVLDAPGDAGGMG
jgi:hypothetical protein